VLMDISGISVSVTKKKIKNMHLYVKPPYGEVSLSAPLHMSDDAIERFVRTKMSWLRKHISAFENQPRLSKREYVTGETLYVWGKQYFLQVDYGIKNSMELSGDKAILTVRTESTLEQREKFVKEWYRRILKEEIARLLPKWEEKTGLYSTGWQTKYMTTRWGSCNVKTGKIWLNLQLAKKPLICLEYIILHELAHLVEKKHGDGFIALMDKFMPMWSEVKDTLNKEALDYME